MGRTLTHTALKPGTAADWTTCIARSAVPASVVSAADASKLSSLKFSMTLHTVPRVAVHFRMVVVLHRRQVLEHVHHRRQVVHVAPAKFS
jgi:hypothetical protein